MDAVRMVEQPGMATKPQAIEPGDSPPQQLTQPQSPQPGQVLRVKQFDIIDQYGFEQPVVAASFLAPSDWQLEGGVNWNAQWKCIIDMVVAKVRASSPDGRLAFELLPLASTQWSDDPALVQTAQQAEAMGQYTCPVRQPFNAANYITGYLVPQTRLGAQVTRDVQYSYEQRTPYYIQTGWTATLTQRVTGRWDAQVTGGRDRLRYEAISSRDARTDFVGRFGGGIGYSINDLMRIGFSVDSFQRTSDLPGREYRVIRSGLSVTYGY